jgi:threonine dehydratase
MGAGWNISLFHYRTQGSDFGRVLIGLEISESQDQALKHFLDNLGYRYVEETGNEAYQLFL